MVYGQNISQPFATGRGPRKFGVVIAAIMTGIVALFVMVPRLDKPQGRDASGTHGVGLHSPSERAIGSRLATDPVARDRHEVETPPSPSVRAKANSSLIPSITGVSLTQYSAWFTRRLKTLLGLRASAGFDAAKARALVWAVKSSGFYYCTHDAYWGKLKPGKIMKQGNALQRGYTPRLGNYCQ